MKDIREYDKLIHIDDFDKYLEDLRTENKNFNDLINYECKSQYKNVGKVENKNVGLM